MSESIIAPPKVVDPEQIQREAKQRYLVKEIIEQGYDQEQFSKFLLAQKVGCKVLNIDEWNF